MKSVKKTVLKSVFLVVALCLIPAITRADSQTIVGTLTPNGAQLTANQAVRQALLQGAVEELGEGTTIDSLYLELYGEQWYLIATGTALTPAGTESRIVGAPLNPDMGGNLRFAADKIKHKCQGSPCAKCRFTKDVTGDIDGCACGKGGTLCNHTIESGGNSGGWFGSNIY